MIRWFRGGRQFTADNFAILAEMSDGAAFFDKSGAVLFFNQAYGDLFSLDADSIGVSFEQVLRRALTSGRVAGHTADATEAETDRFLCRHLPAFEEGTRGPALELADGRWLRATHHKVADGTLSLLTDITDIMGDEAARRLRESEQRNRAVVAASLDAIVTIDMEGGIVDFNPAAERTFGHRLEDVRGKSLGDVIVPPRHRANHHAGMRRLADGQPPRVLGRRIEIEAQRANGEIFPVELAITQIPLLGGHGFTAFVRDITDARRAQQEIDARNRLLMEMMRAVDLGIAIFDADRLLVRANAQFGQLLRLPDDLLSAGTHAEWIEGHLTAEGAVIGTDGRADALDDKATSTLSMADGRHLLRDLFRMADGGLVQVVKDVTEQRRLQENLLQAQRMEALGQMAAGIAHELNNMLSVISGYARIASRAGGNGGGEGGNALVNLQLTIQRAGIITRELLTFARQRPTQSAVIDLATVIDSQRGLLGHVLGEAVGLECLVPRDPVWVRFNPDLATQSLVNLAINARNAMPDGGTLRVTLGKGRRSLPGGTDQPCAVLTVSDNGTGMTADVRARIFEPFFSTRPVGQGTGLGLALVYGAITEAGGDIEVASEPGVGTVFTVYLPLETPEQGDRPPAPADRLPPANSVVPLMNLLLNDDRHARDHHRMRCSRPLDGIVMDAAEGLFDLWGVRELVLSVRLDGELLHQMRLAADGPPPDLSPLLSRVPAPIAAAATRLLTLDIHGSAAGPPPVHLHLQPPSLDDQPVAGRLTLILEAWPDLPAAAASPQGRVLLVEDSGPLAELLGQYLGSSGFQVMAAATGTMGLALATAQDFDLVISDLGVPGIDGLALFRAIRALPDTRRAAVPFLMVTGNIAEPVQARIRAAGIAHLMEKPLDCDELVRRAARLSGLTIDRPPERLAVPAPPRPGAIDPSRIRGWLEKVPLAHVRDLIQRLPAQIEGTLAQADECDRAGSTAQCVAALHLLASTTGAVGMVGVVRELTAAERALQAPHPAPLAERLPAIRALVADALSDLSAVVAEAERQSGLHQAPDAAQERID